jgi:acetyl esterase/lipase
MALFPRPIDLVNRSVGLAGVRVERGLEYGNHPRQRLDVYMPQAGGENLPVMVFFYGGSWQSGDRADYAFVAALLARRGFVVAVPDYRVYDEVKFPAFIEDCAAAVDWVFRHAMVFDGDANAVFLLGHSAGAYNAVMLGLKFSDRRNQIAGVIGLSGPYDFLPLKDRNIKAIFSAPADIADTQPITYVHADAPPMFLATGGMDRTVMPRNTTALAARIRALGGVVDTKIYPKLGHIGIILAILPYFAWRAPVLNDVLEFCANCRTSIPRPVHSENTSGVVG